MKPTKLSLVLVVALLAGALAAPVAAQDGSTCLTVDGTCDVAAADSSAPVAFLLSDLGVATADGGLWINSASNDLGNTLTNVAIPYAGFRLANLKQFAPDDSCYDRVAAYNAALSADPSTTVYAAIALQGCHARVWLTYYGAGRAFRPVP